MNIDFSPLGDTHRLEDFAAPGASADPLAGTKAPNGKDIWTAQQAADNLSRPNVDWTFGNNGALSADDRVLTYGFWTSLTEVQASYYTEKDKDGFVLTADGDYIIAGAFAPFTAAQQAMAIANMQLWDDLIDVTFQPASSAAAADITFGFVQMSPAAGAHAYYPQEEELNETYGFVNAGKVAGDVWANYLHQDSFVDTSIGNYAWQAITHELGHSLGLAHGGDYNASDDDDGDGVPDPITYEGDAYFYQDSQQYTIMSYFDGSVTGQAAVVWAGADSHFVYAQTPQVHDIKAVQDIYGADFTTRSGNTVYGFNSTADRGVFDFSTNKAPIVTIWDGGGNDTLDLSGFDANNIIDINEGAFSSAGYKIDEASKAVFGITTEAQMASFAANNGLGPDGRPVDNIAIAYGAQIENAIGGSGNDLLISNALNNNLKGNAGNDTVSYDRAATAVTVDLVAQTATGGGGNDTLDSIESAIGSAFNDTLIGTAGDNTLEGGSGNDTLTAAGGNDTVVYVRSKAGVNVSLVAGTATSTDGNDTISGFENIIGSGFADTLTGDANANQITGGKGNDALDGGAGIDTALYNTATGAVNVNLFAGTAAGADGTDTLSGFENVTGSSFGDTIVASNVDNIINAGAGADTVSYANATAGVNVNLGTGVVTGGSGNDTLISVERVIGSGFNDSIIGSAGANIISAGAGTDRVAAGNGLDVVSLGAGNDTFVAELGTKNVAMKTGTFAVDIITDFTRGQDRIDLSGLGSFVFGDTDKNKTADTVSYKSYGNINAAEAALGFDIDGQPGASGVSGPVTIVYVNDNGGPADAAIVLLGVAGVGASDFVLG